MNRDEGEGLSLSEAENLLVDSDLLNQQKNFKEKLTHLEEKRNRTIKKARAEGRSAETELKKIEQEKNEARSANRPVSKKIEEQFITALAECHVRAREGMLTAPYTEIPKSALPSLGPDGPFRLQVTSVPLSRMSWWKPRGASIAYYDVRVWLPDKKPDPSIEHQQERPRHVSTAELYAFLSGYCSAVGPGDERLTAKSILAAAKAQFCDRTVSRSRVRDWIQQKMPPEKRFRRGIKPIGKSS